MAFREVLGPAVVRAGMLSGVSALVSAAFGLYPVAVGLIAGFAVVALNLWLLSRTLMRALTQKRPDPYGRVTAAQFLLRFLLFTIVLAVLAEWSGPAFAAGFVGAFSIKIMLYLEGFRAGITREAVKKR